MSRDGRTVTVALVGSAEHAFTSDAIDWEHDFNIPWIERRKVELAIDDDTTLDQILRAAATSFGIEVPPQLPGFGFCAFYSEGHEAQFGGLRYEVTLADNQGRAIWGVHQWRDTPLRALLDAADRGVFAGDPTRIYLVPIGPAGDGIFLGWSQLLEAMRIAYDVAEVVATGGGAVVVGKYVLDVARARLKRGRDAVEQGYLEWDLRGATPKRLDDFLRERTWHSADLARALDCSDELAAGILEAWGFVRAESGLWRLDQDEPARLIRKLHEEIVTSAALPSTDPFERVYRQRVEPLVTTGEPVPVPERTPDADEDLEGFETELLEGQALVCQCGELDCTARVYLLRSWPASEDSSRLRFKIENYVDHFDFRITALGTILGHMAEL